MDGPPNPVAFPPDPERKIEDSLSRLLAQLELSHCLGILRKCGYKSVARLQMLKIHLGKDKTREEIRRNLQGGGMVLRDWLSLSEYLVPEYG